MDVAISPNDSADLEGSIGKAYDDLDALLHGRVGRNAQTLGRTSCPSGWSKLIQKWLQLAQAVRFYVQQPLHERKQDASTLSWLLGEVCPEV